MHSFAGLPFSINNLTREGFNDLLEEIKHTPWKKRAYTNTDVLVIDEASMLHPSLLDILNLLMKELRDPQQRDLPFGGLQIIICGDFFQLPPVVSKKIFDIQRCDLNISNDNWRSVQSYSQDPNEPPYLFDATAWMELINNGMQMVELQNIYRQTEPLFLRILEEIRSGSCSRNSWSILNEHRNKKWPSDGILVSNMN